MRRLAAPLLLAFALAPAPARAGTVELTGKAFADFSYRRNFDDGALEPRDDSGLGADVKRFYAGADWKLSDVFSAHFLTDVGDRGGKRYDVFVKAAFVEAKVRPELVLRLGAAANPWIPFVEDAWGHRYVENVAVDRVGLGNSADWGLHLLGAFAGGVVGYQLSVVNGRGYSDPTRAMLPSVEARVNARLLGHLELAAGAAASTFGEDLASKAAAHWGTRYDLFAGWVSETFRVGAEGFLAHDYLAGEVTGAKPEDDAQGASAFLAVRFLGRYGAFARFDAVEPRATTNPGLVDTYLDAGLEVTPVEHVTVALAAKHEIVQAGTTDAGSIATANGTIGSTVAGRTGRYDEVGVFTEFKF